MGHWPLYPFKMMELSIETLQGSTFGLKVSLHDLIGDVKARIYKSQGIPISQQHLILGSIELDDDNCLQDYNIQDGSVLKLVPTMRVGPINTRRIPIEDPLLRDCSDYFSEAMAREELYDKLAGSSGASESRSGARPLTVIVYQNGDQINLYRIVDRDSASPLSESLSNASVYGMCDEDEEENETSTTTATTAANKEKREENEQLQLKMKILKNKLDQQKKPKQRKPTTALAPHPPTSARGTTSGHTGGGAGAITSTALRPTSRSTRLHRLTSGGALAQSAAKHISFNPKSRLPPVLGTAPTVERERSALETQRKSQEALHASSTTAALDSKVKSEKTAKTSDLENNVSLTAAPTKLALKSASTSEISPEQAPVARTITGSHDLLSTSTTNAASKGVKCPASAPITSPRRQLGLPSSSATAMPPASKASLNRLTSVLENEPTPASDAAAAAMNASTSGRVSGSATGRYHNMNELDALEAILRKAQQGTSRRNSSSNLSMTSPTTRRSTTSAARRYDFSQEALLSGSGLRTSPRMKKEGQRPPSTSGTYLYKEPLKSGRRSSNARPNLDRLLSDPSGAEGSSSASASSRPATTQKLGATAASGAPTLEALKESLDGLHATPTQTQSTLNRHQATSTSGRRSGGGRKSHMGGVVLETLNPSQVRVVSGVLSSLVKNGATSGSGSASGVSPTATSKSRNGFVTSTLDGRITPTESRLLSARLRLSNTSARDRISLPPVKHKKKAPSKRCAVCNKKTGLAASFLCRCGNNFCATHRYAESHSCSFDYKSNGRKLLEQANPVVTAPKLPKI